MLGFAALVCAIVAVGFAALEILERKLVPSERDGLESLERTTAAVLLGGSLWLAANWALALTHTLTRPAVLAVSVVFGVAGAAYVLVRWPLLRSLSVDRPTGRQLAFLLPLLLWTAFILWRGTVLPPLSHDVLGYHLPKAVMIMRAHGFEFFAAPDSRISSLPSNYELLLADILVLSGTDRLTEWIGTVTFLFFLLATGAVAQRWWRGGAQPVVAILAMAGAPVVLLHSGADKNDLMLGFFSVCALVWGARWAAHGGMLSLVLTIASLTAGAGTKPQQAAILAGLLPFLAYRAVAEVRRSRRFAWQLPLIAIAAVAWFAFTGGAAYAFNAMQAASPLKVQIGDTTAAQNAVFQWGDWSNVWEFPLLLLLVPFCKPYGVWVPWRDEYWFWPHYEIYFSHFGVLFSLLMVAMPASIFALRRAEPRERAAERLIYTAAAAVALLLTLPVDFQPHGMFAAFARYVLFVAPAILCWTLVPFCRRYFTTERPLRSYAILGMLALAFVMTAVSCATNDRFAPLEFALWAAERPGTRVIWFSQGRAGSVVDRLAGPRDTVAVDGSWDTWIHPIYGAHLTRNVVFLPRVAAGMPVPIPDQAQWVVIDRSRNSIWGHPKLTDMGRFFEYISRGSPLPEEVAVLRQLRRDPRFALVYYEPRINQALFWRRVPGFQPPRVMFRPAPQRR